MDLLAQLPAVTKILQQREETPSPKLVIKDQKLDCLRCVKHDRAIGKIVTFDILSGLLIFPLLKAVSANRFQNDVGTFERYLKERLCSIVIQSIVLGLSIVGAINAVAWNHLHWIVAVSIVSSLTFLSAAGVALDLHLQSVLKSALKAYKDNGEVPKMFTQAVKVKTQPASQIGPFARRRQEIIRNVSSEDSSSFSSFEVQLDAIDQRRAIPSTLQDHRVKSIPRKYKFQKRTSLEQPRKPPSGRIEAQKVTLTNVKEPVPQGILKPQ